MLESHIKVGVQGYKEAMKTKATIHNKKVGG